MMLQSSARVAKMAVRQAPAMAPLVRTFADSTHAPPIALFGLEAKVRSNIKPPFQPFIYSPLLLVRQRPLHHRI